MYCLFVIANVQLRINPWQGIVLLIGTILAALAIPFFSSKYFFDIPLSESYLYHLPYSYYLEPYSFEPTLFLGFFFFILVLSFPVAKLLVFIQEKYFSKFNIHYSNLANFILILIIPFSVLTGTYFIKFDDSQKSMAMIQYCAENNNWEQLLEESKTISSYDRVINFNINRALYHTGYLLEKMFNYRQLAGIDALFLSKLVGSQTVILSSDISFEIGHITASKVFAYEGFTKFKYNPHIIKRLVETNMILGEIQLAKKFNQFLGASLIYNAEANNFNSLLEKPSLIKSNSAISKKRNQIVPEDFFISYETPGFDLYNIVRQDRSNVMAVEYFFAALLLDGDLTTLYKNLHLLSYKSKLPRHIQEALILHAFIRKMDVRKLIKMYSLDSKIVNEFINYNKILKSISNKSKAKNSLNSYSNTYWYYMHFLHPKITGFKMKKQAQNVNMYKF